MRIAMVTWSRRRVGGVETYLSAVVPALAAAGHEIAFWCEVDRPVDRDPIPLPAGSPVICAETRGVDAAAAELRAWRPDLLYAHGLRDSAIERRLLDIAPAVFLAHNYHGTCISGAKTFKSPTIVPCERRFGWPCLVHYYPRRCGGWSPVTMLGDYRRQTSRLDTLGRYRAVVTLSSHMREEYVRHGLDASRVFHVREVAAAPPPPARTAAAAEGWRLLFLGRMDRLKGGSYLIDALPRVARAVGAPLRLTFAGDGPARARWERRAAACTAAEPLVRIDFAGWLDRAAIDRRLEASDLLVLPSLWPEPFGLVGLEAARHWLPVAAFAVGGVPDWLRPGLNGQLADGHPPTVEGLAGAMAACLKDPETHATLRAGAGRISAELSFREHARTLDRLFERIVAEPRPSLVP
jgi:glycosyltransferase involved in cell wall biosynthesis